MIRLEVSYEIKVKTIDLLFQHYCYLTPLFNIFFRFTYVMASLSGSQEGIGSTSSDQSQENSNIRLRVAERSRTSAGRRFRDVDLRSRLLTFCHKELLVLLHGLSCRVKEISWNALVPRLLQQAALV